MLENDEKVDIVIFAGETLEVEITDIELVEVNTGLTEDTTDYLLVYNLAKV